MLTGMVSVTSWTMAWRPYRSMEISTLLFKSLLRLSLLPRSYLLEGKFFQEIESQYLGGTKSVRRLYD